MKIKIEISEVKDFLNVLPVSRLYDFLCFLSRIPEVEIKDEVFKYVEKEIDLCRDLKYQHYFKPISQSELIKTFPESVYFIVEKIDQLLQEKQVIKLEFEYKIKKNIYNEAEYILLIELYKSKLERVEKEIKRLRNYLYLTQSNAPVENKHFSKEDIDVLKQTYKINHLFTEFFPDIQLRKVGKNIVCRCPFHPDKNPSFYINPQKNLFYCFGCNLGGDVIKFVMLAKNLNFKQAINFLKRR
ncbi:MAG: CHC2 zinc finger domain-containing protein [candidate division WOR-3 bacterium]